MASELRNAILEGMPRYGLRPRVSAVLFAMERGECSLQNFHYRLVCGHAIVVHNCIPFPFYLCSLLPNAILFFLQFAHCLMSVSLWTWSNLKYTRAGIFERKHMSKRGRNTLSLHNLPTASQFAIAVSHSCQPLGVYANCNYVSQLPLNSFSISMCFFSTRTLAGVRQLWLTHLLCFYSTLTQSAESQLAEKTQCSLRECKQSLGKSFAVQCAQCPRWYPAPASS